MCICVCVWGGGLETDWGLLRKPLGHAFPTLLKPGLSGSLSLYRVTVGNIGPG